MVGKWDITIYLHIEDHNKRKEIQHITEKYKNKEYSLFKYFTKMPKFLRVMTGFDS